MNGITDLVQAWLDWQTQARSVTTSHRLTFKPVEDDPEIEEIPYAV